MTVNFFVSFAFFCWVVAGVLVKMLSLPVGVFLLASTTLVFFGLFRQWINGATTWNARRFLTLAFLLSFFYALIAVYASRDLEPSVSVSEITSIFVKFVFGSLVFIWVCCLNWENSIFRKRANLSILCLCLLLLMVRIPTAFQTGLVIGSLHSNYTGIAAASFILMQWYLYLDKNFDVLAKCVIFFSSILLLMSVSRASVLALAFGIAAFYGFSWLGRKRLMLSRTIITVIVVVLTYFTLNVDQLVQENDLVRGAATAAEQITGKSVLENGRFGLWEKAGILFYDSPVTGSGVGARRSWERYLNDGRVITLSVHNQYLSILTEAGILGILIFLALFIGVFRYGTGVSGARMSLMLSGLVFCFVFSIFQGSMVNGASMSGVWLWLVLGCAARVTLASATDPRKTYHQSHLKEPECVPSA